MGYVVWVGFLVFVLVMVMLDLGVFHRQARGQHSRGARLDVGLDFAGAGV